MVSAAMSELGHLCARLTQTIIYVPLQVNIFQKSILLIVQYKYLKSCSGNFILQNLILRTRSCGTGFVAQSSWVFHFHQTTLVWWKCFVPQLYQFRRGISGGTALGYFYVIHRGGQRGSRHGSGFGKGGLVGVVGSFRTKRYGVSSRGAARFVCFQRGLDLELLCPSAREGLISKAYRERSRNSLLQKRTEATEACARKIAQSEGKDQGSMWTPTQESYPDEAETVCHSCYVGGSALQTQKDAFHNLLIGVVRHWMGEDYWGDETMDRKKGSRHGPPPDINGFTHSKQTLQQKVMNKFSMTTTKLRLTKIVTPSPVFEEHWDPNTVISLVYDQGSTLDVKLLELLCLTCRRYKARVARAFKIMNDGSGKSLANFC